MRPRARGLIQSHSLVDICNTRMLPYRAIPLLLLLGCYSMLVCAQDEIRYTAKSGRIEKTDGKTLQHLWDEVVFRQKTAVVSCDSSVFYKSENLMHAFDNVLIVDGNTTIESKRLVYRGTERTATLFEDVVYKNGMHRMFTQQLHYDTNSRVAKYESFGKLTDSLNVLTSRVGTYFGQYATFLGNVVLVNPDYTLSAERLDYDFDTRLAKTFGHTVITNFEGDKIYSDGGTFQTLINLDEFEKGRIETRDNTLEGDQLYFDRQNQYYKAVGNVVLTSKIRDMVITGREGYYNRMKGFSKIFGSPVLTGYMEEDTLYMASDTILSVESQFDSLNRIHAYHDVRIFSDKFQAVADSSCYFLQDSLLYLYHEPVVFTGKIQVMSDTVSLEITEKLIDKIHFFNDAFLVVSDTLNNSNQMKGRRMTGFFDDNDLHRVDINGNSDSLFYVLNDEQTDVRGINRVQCSNSVIQIADGQVRTFTSHLEVEGYFTPPQELSAEDRFLSNFVLLDSLRPSKTSIVNPESLEKEAKARANEIRAKAAPDP